MQLGPDPRAGPDDKPRYTVDFDAPKHGGSARQAQPLTST